MITLEPLKLIHIRDCPVLTLERRYFSLWSLSFWGALSITAVSVSVIRETPAVGNISFVGKSSLFVAPFTSRSALTVRLGGNSSFPYNIEADIGVLEDEFKALPKSIS